jgi:hypothetical protein
LRKCHLLVQKLSWSCLKQKQKYVFSLSKPPPHFPARGHFGPAHARSPLLPPSRSNAAARPCEGGACHVVVGDGPPRAVAHDRPAAPTVPAPLNPACPSLSSAHSPAPYFSLHFQKKERSGAPSSTTYRHTFAGIVHRHRTLSHRFTSPSASPLDALALAQALAVIFARVRPNRVLLPHPRWERRRGHANRHATGPLSCSSLLSSTRRVFASNSRSRRVYFCAPSWPRIAARPPCSAATHRRSSPWGLEVIHAPSFGLPCSRE